jgi:hypothetical protein
MPPTQTVVMLLVGWILYSTEELATLMEAPLGGVDSGGVKPETLSLDFYCDKIVSELKQQAVINRAIDRRVDEGRWVVKPSDLAFAPPASARGNDASSPERRGRYGSDFGSYFWIDFDVDARDDDT